MAQVSPRQANATFGALSLLASLGLSVSVGKSLSTDEGASLYSAHLSWSALWEQSHFVDRVFLPYYAILHVWLLVDFSIGWARVLSLLAYAVTVYLTGRLAFRLGGYWCGVAAAVFCAGNPLLVQGALDARPYALSALAATVSVVCLLRALDDGENRWLWRFTTGAIVTATMQFFAVLAPLAALAGAAVMSPKLVKVRYRAWTGPICVFLVATAAFAALTIGQRGQIDWLQPFTLSTFAAAFYGPAGADSHLGRIIFTLLALGALLAVFVTFVHSWQHLKSTLAHRDLEHFAVILCWAVLPTIVLIAGSFVKPVYQSRYVTASAPGLAIVLGLLVARAYELHREESRGTSLAQRAGVLVVAAALVASMALAATHLDENVKQGSQSLARDVGVSGVAAFPNRLIVEEFETYLGGKYRRLAKWPLVANPRSFNQLDLRHASSVFANAPNNVWLANDSSSVNVGEKFTRMLTSHGYVQVGVQDFPDIVTLYIAHFRR